MTRKRRPGRASGYQVGPDMLVGFSYRLFDAEGELVVESAPGEPIGDLFGRGEMSPALEGALARLVAGASKAVTLTPDDAYGVRDDGAILEVDRSEFPPDVALGDELCAEDASGRPVPLKVLDVKDDVLVLDTNHPLAGQTVRLEVSIAAVRPATAEELAAADAQLEQATGAADPLVSGLIPLERLRRGRSRRYENGRPRPGGDDS